MSWVTPRLLREVALCWYEVLWGLEILGVAGADAVSRLQCGGARAESITLSLELTSLNMPSHMRRWVAVD